MKYTYNEEQREAIEHNKGPALVIAGPGSGKTTVLTRRIHNLISKCKVRPEDILVITFTKAAAVEMEKRFNAISETSGKVTFGTFHAVFFKILRAAYNYKIENVLKEEQRGIIIRQAIERSALDTDDINETVQNVSAEISKVKSEGLDINAYYSTSCAASEFQKIYNSYQRTLRNNKLIDFDDMLMYCYDLLKNNPPILKYWQERYKYILVDEFQDINKLQYEVVKLLALPQNNLFIVGDDDQSIYAFRGSKPEIMLNFEKDYSNVHKITLNTNYRCTGNIVKSSSKLIANNKIRFQKELTTVNPAGNQVEIIEYEDAIKQYQAIADEIKKELLDKKAPNDFAILFRTNAIAEPLIRKLMEKNIDFAIRDGIPNIFKHWIATDILTYMRMALGSRKRSDFIQVMNKPKRYIGRDYLDGSEISFKELAKLYEDKPWMYERLEQFEKDLNIMRTLPPYAMINYLRMGVGYDDYLKEYAYNHNIPFPELIDKLNEIQDSAKNHKTFASWMEHIEEYSRAIEQSHKAGKDCVTLTTMHSAKGLEYDTVFIIDANEEITPHKKGVTDSDIEEERRIFYVAMTRARQRLVITYSQKRYNKEQNISRFLDEIML